MTETNEADEEMLVGASADGWSTEDLRALIDGGADVNKRDHTGRSPIFGASKDGHLECVKALIDAGADVKCYNTGAFRSTLRRNHVEFFVPTVIRQTSSVVPKAIANFKH